MARGGFVTLTRRTLLSVPLAAPFIRSAAAADELVFGSYGGSIEQYLRKDLLPDFEKETGIKVTYVAGTALSLLSKVAATRSRPEFDVYWANDLTHAAGKAMGLFDKVDPAVVTVLNEVIDGGRDPQDIGVTTHIASTGLQYNAEKFKQAGWAPPTSWFDLWDPKFKGKVAMYSISVLYAQEMLGAIARLTGGSESNIGPGLKKIKALKDMGNIAAFANSPAEMDNIMAQGQAWITYNGHIRSLLMKSQGAPMEYVVPKEGAVRFSLYADPVKGAPHPAAAQKFIQFFLRKDIQERCAEGIFYAPANKNAVVRPDLAAVMPYGERAIAALIKLDRDPMNRDLSDWIEQWNRSIES